jgi:CRISPR system Cascade subunit CasE
MLIGGNGYGAHQLLWRLFPNRGAERSFLFREEIAREQIPFHKGVKGEPIFYLVSGAEPVSNHPMFAVESKPYAPKLLVGDHLAFRLRANPTIARKTEGKKNSVRHDVVMDAQYHFLREFALKMNAQVEGDKSQIKRRLIATCQQLPDPKLIEDDLRGIISGNETFADLAEKPMPLPKLFDAAVKSRMNKVLETWFLEKGERFGFALIRDHHKKRLKFQAEGYQWHALPKKGKSAGFSSIDFEGEIEVVNTELLTRALFNGIGPSKSFGCGLMLVRRV